MAIILHINTHLGNGLEYGYTGWMIVFRSGCSVMDNMLDYQICFS